MYSDVNDALFSENHPVNLTTSAEHFCETDSKACPQCSRTLRCCNNSLGSAVNDFRSDMNTNLEEMTLNIAYMMGETQESIADLRTVKYG